jgi:DNA-binding transcriptional LysR family regulator
MRSATVKPRIDLYNLRLFVAVAQEGSIARAADREHLAASALSRRLADLEHSLGVALLVRSSRGIELTDAGKYVFERGTTLEDDLRNLAKEACEIDGSIGGTVRLYANTSAIVGYLPERLRQFKIEHPAVEISLHEHLSDEVIRACMDDRADVGIAVAATSPTGLDSWHFALDPLSVLMPSGHALVGRDRIKLEDAVRYGLVGIQPGGALDRLMRESAFKAKIDLKHSVTVNSFDAVCRMLEAGLGVAIVPKSAAAAYAGTEGFVRRPLDEDWVERELRVYTLHKSPRQRATEALIDVLKR